MARGRLEAGKALLEAVDYELRGERGRIDHQKCLPQPRPVAFVDEERRGFEAERGARPEQVAAKVSIPVLMLTGSEDYVNPIDKNAAILAKAMPKAKLAGIGLVRWSRQSSASSSCAVVPGSRT